MNPLIVQLAAVFAPLIMDIIRRHQAAHPGSLPTDEEIIGAFTANIDKYLKEGADWIEAHPKTAAILPAGRDTP